MSNSNILFPGDLTGKKLRTRSRTESDEKVEDLVVTAVGAKGFQMEDDDGNSSPLTVSDTQIDILVPDNAIAFVYQARGADMKISDVDGMASHVVILDGNGDTLECDDIEKIYVKRDAGVNAELHFYFKII